VNERNQELIFVADGLNFVVGIEDFAFVQAQ
jgi:hypothetical protein